MHIVDHLKTNLLYFFKNLNSCVLQLFSYIFYKIITWRQSGRTSEKLVGELVGIGTAERAEESPLESRGTERLKVFNDRQGFFFYLWEIWERFWAWGTVCCGAAVCWKFVVAEACVAGIAAAETGVGDVVTVCAGCVAPCWAIRACRSKPWICWPNWLRQVLFWILKMWLTCKEEQTFETVEAAAVERQKRAAVLSYY